MQVETPREARRPGRRAYLLVALFALALVLLPFWFWYNTWFGRKLSDADLDAYFADRVTPRHIQQALVQVDERVSHGRNAARWYPRVLEQAASANLEIRQTAAWVMGHDRAYVPFHEALLKLLYDAEPMVRRNAALGLAGMGDGAGRGELRAMLRPFPVRASMGGAVRYRLKPGDYVNPGTLLARVGRGEVRSPAPGEVRSLAHKDGDIVAAGDTLTELSMDEHHVWEALRALYLVGQVADLDDVRRFMRPVPGMPESVIRQAALTAHAIAARVR